MMLFLALLACTPEPATPKTEPPTRAATEPPAPAVSPPSTIEPPASSDRVLAPSPEETRRTVEKAGIQATLGSLVEVHSFKLDAKDPDRTALRTGVVLADAILTIRESTPADLGARLGLVVDGLTAMGAGKGLLSTMADIRARADNGAPRDDLLKSLDEIASMAVPEEGVGPNDRTGPLLQAGAWLEGTSLVARAILKENKPEAAEQLLRQKSVINWFLEYVRGPGQSKLTSPDIRARLESTLVALQEITSRPTLGLDEAEEVRDRTAELLSLL